MLLISVQVLSDEALEIAQFTKFYIKTCAVAGEALWDIGIDVVDDVWMPEDVQE